jgi:hypothetical protein
MIRPLRRAHRLIWILIPVVTILILALGVLTRRPTTPTNANFRWDTSK